MRIYTAGHYDYALETFLEVLKKAGVTEVMDVRAFPNSKKHPQYNQTALREWLEAHGVDVKHIVVNHQDKIEIVPHELGQWGAMPIIEDDGEVVYPVKDD